MSNVTSEKKDLEQLIDVITFNNKCSNIVDGYLFNKETTMSGLKRKREPENIIGTKKSKKKKRLRRL